MRSLMAMLFRRDTPPDVAPRESRPAVSSAAERLAALNRLTEQRLRLARIDADLDSHRGSSHQAGAK